MIYFYVVASNVRTPGHNCIIWAMIPRCLCHHFDIIAACYRCMFYRVWTWLSSHAKDTTQKVRVLGNSVVGDRQVGLWWKHDEIYLFSRKQGFIIIHRMAWGKQISACASWYHDAKDATYVFAPDFLFKVHDWICAVTSWMPRLSFWCHCKLVIDPCDCGCPQKWYSQSYPYSCNVISPMFSSLSYLEETSCTGKKVGMGVHARIVCVCVIFCPNVFHLLP